MKIHSNVTLNHHEKSYSFEELVERSADLERLIQLLIDFTSIPHNLRGCSTEIGKAHRIAKDIYEVVRVNKELYQPNIIQQNLFDL